MIPVIPSAPSPTTTLPSNDKAFHSTVKFPSPMAETGTRTVERALTLLELAGLRAAQGTSTSSGHG